MEHARSRGLVAALALAFTLPAFAGAGFWSSNGPYGGNVYRVASEPGNHNNMYAQSRGAFWRSVDAGDSWQPADSGLRAAFSAVPIMVDAEQPQDVYVFDASYRLHRSSDRGVNWTATGFEPDLSVWPLDLVDLPGNVGHMLLLVNDDRTGGSQQQPLYRSNDGGLSFSLFGNGLPAGGAAVDLAIDPADSSDMLLVYAPPGGNLASPVAWQPSIYRSTDGGANWTAVHTPSGTTQFYPYVGFGALEALSFSAGDVVYASNGINPPVRSNDRGATWAEFTLGTGMSPGHLIADPADADRFWFTFDDSAWLTTDGGATANRIDNGLTPNDTYLHDTELGREIGLEVMHLHAAPGFPGTAGRRLWVAADGGGLYQSGDLGSSWAASELGLLATQIRALAVDPNPGAVSAGNRTIYAGFGDAFYSSPAMYRRNRISGQWEQHNNNLTASQIRDVVVDPTTARAGVDPITGAHLYAVGRGAFAPGFLSPPLYKSTDSGSTWSTIAAGLPQRDFGGGNMEVDLGTVRRVVLDPRSCDAEPRPPSAACAELPPAPNTSPLKRVYVSSSGFRDFDSMTGESDYTHRLLRSDDAGATWTRLDGNTGFPASRNFPATNGAAEDLFIFAQVVPIGIAIAPDDPDLVFVSTFPSVGCQNNTLGTPCSDTDRLAHADVPSGVFRSTNRGATWTAVNNGLPRQSGGYTNTVASVLSLAMHPTDPDTLWASITDLELDRALWPPSIFRTNDGGTTWVASATGIPTGVDIRAITVDPGDGDILYASGAGTEADPGSVYKSEDGGLTWTSISIGLPASSALALAVDPFNPTILHAGTNTGVWSIEQLPDEDGDGAPDTMELNAPNGGDGNDDGIVDYQQSGVGSTIVLFANRKHAALAQHADRAKGVGPGYTTTEVVGGTGTCAQAVDVQTRFASQFGRDFIGRNGDYFRYPRDLAQFEVMDCGAATVDLVFHNADFSQTYGWSLRYYGPSTPGNEDTIGWHDASALAERVGPNRWRVDLEANAFGSYRPVDDRILFVGGPACYDDRIFVSDFEQVSRALPGCAN